MHISQILLYFCIGVILAIAVATRVELPESVAVIAVSSGLLLFCCMRNRYLRYACVVACGFALGLWRCSDLPDYSSNPYDQMVQFRGVVAREPEVMNAAQRMVVATRAVEGHVQMKVPLRPRYEVGDIVEVNCMLRRPEPFDGFAYDKYLERYGVGGLCYYPGIKHTGTEESWQRRLFAAKAWIINRFRHTFAPPEQGVILGTLFGDKHAITKEIGEVFQRTGTTHILVISGSHFSLITTILVSFFGWMRVPKRMSVVCIVVVLLLYAFLTGMQAAAIRASIFGVTALVAQIVGRKSSSLRLLVIVGAGMLVVNPLIWWFDAGFQLSFAATAGIVAFNKWFERRMQWIPEAATLRTTAATTCSAIVATTPITVFSFGSFSVIAFAANLIAVPLMTIVMIYGFIVVFIAAVFPLIATWIGLPLYYLVVVLVDIVSWFAAVPFAAITIPPVHWSVAVCCWIFLCWWGMRALREGESNRVTERRSHIINHIAV